MEREESGEIQGITQKVLHKTTMKNKIGRPTKYLPEEIHPKVDEYLAQCSREQTQLPTVEGLAIYLNVAPSTVFKWAEENEGFSEYLKRLAAKQKEQLINDGMYGGKEVNASMAIFLLKAIHRLKENDPSTLVQVNVTPILEDKAI